MNWNIFDYGVIAFAAIVGIGMIVSYFLLCNDAPKKALVKSYLVVLVCFLLFCYCGYMSPKFQTVTQDFKKQEMYVLDGTVPVLVQRTTMDETLDVEAKSHVELFHHLFFTLAPDEKYIDHTMNKAMYLVDETGAAQYNVLKEKGFFDNIIRSKSTFSIYFDSIKFDKSTMEWTYFGHQKIESPSNTTIRMLVTSGKLVCVPTSENNPHGMIITNWRILENYNTKRRNK